MRTRTFRGAAVLAVVVLLASAAIAFADNVPADASLSVAGNQGSLYIGKHTPGEVVDVNVAFRLTCSTTGRALVGSVINVTLAGGTVPLDGAATATPATIGPVPSSWPAPGAPCSSPPQTLTSNGTTVVTLTMPTTIGNGHLWSLMWAKTGDTSGVAGLTFLTFTADVVPNTPPTLSLPGAITVEGSEMDGASVSYNAGAIDAEDNPDPTPACSPASGSLFHVGSTTVNCSVTDRGGLTATGSFRVTVTDTTAPVLDLPANMTEEATGPDGKTIGFDPSANDVVDGPIAISCNHGSGDTFPLGTTTVGCSATDAAGNSASGSFTVTITDTTAPSLTGMPASQALTTPNSAGAPLAYTLPGALDTVDPSPDVSCAPAPGAMAPVGDSTVTCTAKDDAGNSASGTFLVSVAYINTVQYSATWGEPVGGSPAALVANQGRTIPLKVAISANGVDQTAGTAVVRVVSCGGGDPLAVPLAWSSGRWNGHLDTTPLRPGCYVATAAIDGNDAGSFSLDLHGAETAAKPVTAAGPKTTKK